MKIYKNVKIPPHNRHKTHQAVLKIIELITSNTMQVGDMIIVKWDCANIRQRLYNLGYEITVRFDRRQNQYRVWRTK